MVNTFANDQQQLQTIYLALSKAGNTQQVAGVGILWLASVQLSITTLRRLYEAIATLETHIKIWKRRFYDNSNHTGSENPKPSASKPSQLETLSAPFQKAEILKWLQRVYLASFTQVQVLAGDLLLGDYFKSRHTTHYLLRCEKPEQSKTLVQAACTTINQTCAAVHTALQHLELESANILSRPCDELAGFDMAVIAQLLKRKVMRTGFRPVYEESKTLDQEHPNFNVDSAREAVQKLQGYLDVQTVLNNFEPSSQPGRVGEATAPRRWNVLPIPFLRRRKMSIHVALSQAGRQAVRRSMLELPELLVPYSKAAKRLRRAGLAVGCAWLVHNVVQVVRLGLQVTTTVVVPSAAINLPLRLKSLHQKAPIVDPQKLDREKAQLDIMQRELMKYSKKLKDENANQAEEDSAYKMKLRPVPVDVVSSDDADLVMMHALHGASETVEENFMSRLSALNNLNPAHLLKVLSFLMKRTKVQAQDMLLRLDNIARTNNLILSLLTSVPPLLVSLLLHWCITRRLIWVNARPGSNFLLTLHAQMHVVGNVLKAWETNPDRTDLQGAFLFEVAKATRICVKMLHRSRGVCHETLVTLLYDDMIMFSLPKTAPEKLAQFEALMATNPLLKDSA